MFTMKKRIEAFFGKKCDTYEEDCATCLVYEALEEARKEERLIERGLLRHALVGVAEKHGGVAELVINEVVKGFDIISEEEALTPPTV